MNLTERKSNWFVRVLIVLLCLFLTGLIGYRFFVFTPLGDLSPGVLVVLALVVVLVLSESFDSFSIGKLLSLSREVVKKQTEVAEVKRENLELRSQIITIASNVSQHQSSTNIVGLPDTLARMFSVSPAPEEEVREKQAEDQPPRQALAAEKPTRRVDQDRLEEKAITRFLELNNLQQFPVVREAKLMAQMEVADPISTSGPIFDGYLNTLDAEIFVEVRPVGRYGLMMFRERLYLMLSKLYHYRVLKKTNVYLTLVLTTLPDDEVRPSFVNRILGEFQPAITNGLLKVIEINFTEAEAAELFVEEGNAQTGAPEGRAASETSGTEPN